PVQISGSQLAAGSIVQAAEQQSPSTALPSSHASPGPSTSPFPQQPCPASQSAAVTQHAPLPVQRPVTRQSLVHPAAPHVPGGQLPAPRSQVSHGPEITPSPQTDSQAHVAEQPSPPVVLPSSQPSPGSTSPSPHARTKVATKFAGKSGVVTSWLTAPPSDQAANFQATPPSTCGE